MDNNEKKPLQKKGRGESKEKAAAKLKPNQRKPKKFTPLETAFVEHYVLHYNGTRAALAAGYSKTTAASTANALLKKPHIIAAIKAKQAEVCAQIVVSKDMITRELFGMAFADYTEIMKMVEVSDGKGGKKTELQFNPEAIHTPGVGKLIKSMKIGRGGKVEVTFWNKEFALDKLAMHIDYYNAHNKSLPVSSTQIYIPDNGRGDVDAQNIPPLKTE